MTVAAAALGPVVVGLAHETTGTYVSAMAMLVLPVAVGISAALVAPPRNEAATKPAPAGTPAR